MVLMTKNRKLVELARRAYERARVRDDQVLVVWNARVYLNGPLLIMESACPIFLDKIIEQLRLFVESTSARLDQFMWVRASGNRARRWAFPGTRTFGEEPSRSLAGGIR